MFNNLKRFILVFFVGVEYFEEFFYKIFNLFRVLDYKFKVENILKSFSLFYIIIRLGRLIDGFYIFYDLNILIKVISGNCKKIVVG